MLDSREPPNGDFAAFVEKIEREQLARALQPHRLANLSAGGTVSAAERPADGARALSNAEVQRVLQGLKANGKDGTSPPLGAMVGVFIGAALIAFGLLAEGGMVIVILGAVLLWHNLRRLRRAPGGPAGATRQQVEHAFGPTASGTARRRGE